MTDAQKSSDELNSELEKLSADIIDLEHKMEKIHDESGSNSPEDNSQEDTADYISRAQMIEQIEEKRRRMIDIEKLIGHTI